MIELEEFLGMLEKVRRSGSEHMARCPRHDDIRPSLAIRLGDDGRILMHCFGGCDTEDIVSALGMNWSDMFPEREPSNPRRRDDGIVVAEYVYSDIDSNPLYRVLRVRARDGSKSFRQQASNGGGGWLPTLGSVGRVLYRLGDVANACEMGRRVLYVEGEKDVETLRRLDILATTHPGGAGAFRPEYAAMLAGAEVVVLPDNDPAGRKLASVILDYVKGARIVDLPGLPDHGDVTDWINAGHTKEELLKILGPELWATGPVNWEEFHAEQDATRYFLGNALAEETVNILAAIPEIGKTTLINQLCICLAAGVPFLGMSVPQKTRVLLIEAEGSRAIFRSRSEATRVAMGISQEALADTWFIQSKDMSDFRLDAPAIEKHIKKARAEVVVLDTLGYFLAGGDENSANDWKERIMKPLRHLKNAHGCAFILLHHESKPSEWRQGANKGRGTSAMLGDCDTWLSMERVQFVGEQKAAAEAMGLYEEAERERRLVWYKSKVGKKPTPMILDFNDDMALFRLKKRSAVEEFVRGMSAKETPRRSRSSDTDDAFSRGDRIAP